jgi:hypothetical protein
MAGSSGIILPGQTAAASTTPAAGYITFYNDSTYSAPRYKTSAGVSLPLIATMESITDNTVFNVQDYGVSPGNTAAANTAALNALVGVGGSAPAGSVIYFPGGSYQFNAVTVGNAAYIFQGNGQANSGGMTILQCAGTTGFLTLTSGYWYSQFRDLTFTAIANQTSGAAVAVNNNVGVNFYRCNFANFGANYWYDCIDFVGANAANSTVVEDTTMSGYTNYGINVNGAGASLVLVNTIIQGQYASGSFAAAGLVVQNAGAVQADNCDILGNVNNLLINPASGIVVASVYMSNTYMDYAAGSCLKITGAGATVRCKFVAVSFTCNNVSTGTSAVELSSTYAYGANGQGIDFIGCSVLNTFGTTGTTNGFLITGAGDVSILDSRVAGWTNGVNVTPSSANGTTRVSIQDNVIGATGGYAGPTNGVVLNAGSYQFGAVTISDNNFVGCTTPITNNGTYSLLIPPFIANNQGLPLPPGPLVASSAAINTTETYPTTAIPLPANGLQVGSTYRLTLKGTCTTTAANVSTFTVRVGTTGTTPASDTTATAALATTAAGTTGTAVGFEARIEVTCRAIGASTLLEATVTVISGTTGIVAAAGCVAVAASSTFNNNANLYLNVSYKSAATTTTSTFVYGAWEVIKQ